MKNIENVFASFEFDLQQDEDFSEAKLAGYLSELWQALASCGVSNNVTEEFTLSLLAKLENTSFLESLLISSPGACVTEMEFTTATEMPLADTFSANRISQSRRRQVRDISVTDKFDFVKQEIETDDAILDLADDFLLQYEIRKKYPKDNSNRKVIISPRNKSQQIPQIC